MIRKTNKKQKSLTLQVDRPITRRAYIPGGAGGGALITGIYFLFTD